MGAFWSHLALLFAEMTSGLFCRQVAIVKVAAKSPVPVFPNDSVLRGGLGRSEDVSASDLGGFSDDCFIDRNGARFEPTGSASGPSPGKMSAL